MGADRAYEFAWSFNPLPLKGATGSPGNSVAIASRASCPPDTAGDAPGCRGI